MEAIFQGIFDTSTGVSVNVTDFLLCLGVSLLLGLVLTGTYVWKNRSTQSFIVTLALLPAVVCVVIMMVNGNIGAGVAVAGAFSLVRFRSAPGSAKEIVTIFLAMGAGLIAGMGYLGFAALFTLIMCGALLLWTLLLGGRKRTASHCKTVKITIPEDLDYTEVFDAIFADYAKDWELVRVKSTNMGSMFRLTYDLTLRDVTKEKEMIDRLRVRNGNLEITVSRRETNAAEL
ncbi:MAG: DUF4956 domain-containing protein [Clostridia bacterium]|nr:DUF4956 domain-containing protein [Clostridia bacterium]